MHLIPRHTLLFESQAQEGQIDELARPAVRMAQGPAAAAAAVAVAAAIAATVAETVAGAADCTVEVDNQPLAKIILAAEWREIVRPVMSRQVVYG